MANTYLILLFFAVKIFSKLSLVRGEVVSCTFDSGLCGWHSVTSNKFQWKRGSGQTEDRTSGPLNDHTCANYKGEYMFVPGENAESSKDIALLESDLFSIENETSLTFWYIMNGFGTGTLSLSVVRGNTTDELWKKQGRQTKDWVKNTLTLKPGMMKLQFKARVRIPLSSDIAVDDIQLSSESQSKDVNKTHCEVTTSTTTSTTTTTTTLPTTTTAERLNKTHKASLLTTISSSNPSFSSCWKIVAKTDILPGTCDFDKDTCGIKITANDSNKGVTWERTNKMDGNEYRSDNIYGDHTFEMTNMTKGFYLAFRNAWSLWNTKLIARIETPAIYATYACLSFWYNVPTKYSNLKVLIRDYTGRLTSLWSIDNYIPNKKADNMTGWQKESLSISQDPPFTVVFEAYNNFHLAKVGLDDIRITGISINTRGTKPNSEQTTPTSQSINTTIVLVSPAQNTTVRPLSTPNPTSPDRQTSAMNSLISVSGTSIHTTYTSTTTLSNTEPSNKSSTVSTPMTASSKSAFNLTSTTIGNLKTPTVNFSRGTEPQETISYTVTSITPSPSPVTHIVIHSTEKEGKKSTIVTSKKPTKIDFANGDTDKQTEEDKFERTSTIVGSTVGVVLGLVLVVVVVYSIVHSKSKAKRKRRQEMKNKAGIHEQMNGGVSNAGYTSGTCPSTSISKDKSKLNGHAGNTYENFTVYSLTHVNISSHDHKQGHFINGNAHLNGHAAPIAEEEKLTRL